MKTYTYRVYETYAVDFSVEAESEEEAREKVESAAAEDFNLTAPENMTDRELELLDESDD